MLLRFLSNNSGFLGNDLKHYKEFQEFFSNSKVFLDLANKSSPSSTQLSALINEAELLKKIWQDRNFPIHELKNETDRLIKLLEDLLNNNMFVDRFKEKDFSNKMKENIENLEKLLKLANLKNQDYENFINNFIDSDDGKDGFKNTLRALIEYKKKVDGCKAAEEEIQRKNEEINKKIVGYLKNFELIEKWLKRNNDIFKNSDEISLSIDPANGVNLMEKNLK